MATKIAAARKATDAGVNMVLANGEEPSIISDILSGEEVGTLLEEQIPDFLCALGHAVSDSGMDFDTWFAKNPEGIKAIAAEFSKKHQVMVVAPDHERSGASHSINLTSPLRIHKTELSGFDNIEAYRVNGTPVDCVIIGCKALNFKPDAIITGVNHGYNLGMDIHYSGTVSAAKEGALMGIPSMAVSMCNLTSKDFSVPARVAAELFDGFIASGSLLYNVNVPDIAYGELKGIKFTGLSKRTYYSPFEKRVDPRGCEYYWWPMRTEYDGDMKADNDERWTAEGFVSVTPILTDFTDYAALKRLNK